MKKFLVTLVFIGSLLGAHAQTPAPKLGHINSQLLISQMPETQQKQTEFEAYAKKMNQSLEALQVEFNVKYKAYLDSAQALSGPDRTNREMELEGLQKRIEAFQSKAQEDLNKKRQDLFTPIMEKAQNAIKEVGKEEGFYYIFDITTGSIIFAAEGAVDVLDLVKKKLGIQ